jgi:hypothetical protein
VRDCGQRARAAGIRSLSPAGGAGHLVAAAGARGLAARTVAVFAAMATMCAAAILAISNVLPTAAINIFFPGGTTRRSRHRGVVCRRIAAGTRRLAAQIILSRASRELITDIA